MPSLAFSLRDPEDAATATAVLAAAAAPALVGVKLDLRLRPRKANLDLDFGGVMGSPAGCRTGGGDCKSVLVLLS